MSDIVSISPPADLAWLNSLTKFPSIPTFHVMEKGVLTDEISTPKLLEGNVFVTEKVDGANVRIIIHRDQYYLGTRENIVFVGGESIDASTFKVAESLAEAGISVALDPDDDNIYVVYGELYGKGIQNWKAYTHENASKLRDFRVFATAIFPYGRYAHKTPQELAGMRQRGELPLSFKRRELPTELGVIGAKWVPLPTTYKCGLPKEVATVEGAYEWLKSVIDTTYAYMVRNGERGRAEGVVVNDGDRAVAKFRFADYEKALRKRK